MTNIIRGSKAATNMTKIRLFLGLFIVFKRFVPKCATLAAPLRQKVRIDEPLTFQKVNEEELQYMQ